MSENSTHFMKMQIINGRRQKYKTTSACSISKRAKTVTDVKHDVTCGLCLKFLKKRKGE